MTKQIFKAGDLVEAWGYEFTLKENDSTMFPLCAEPNGKKRSFTEDGRYDDWHKTPTLKLISRPEETEEVEVVWWMLGDTVVTKTKGYNPGGNWRKIKPIFT